MTRVLVIDLRVDGASTFRSALTRDGADLAIPRCTISPALHVVAGRRFGLTRLAVVLVTLQGRLQNSMSSVILVTAVNLVSLVSWVNLVNLVSLVRWVRWVRLRPTGGTPTRTRFAPPMASGQR